MMASAPDKNNEYGSPFVLPSGRRSAPYGQYDDLLRAIDPAIRPEVAGTAYRCFADLLHGPQRDLKGAEYAFRLIPQRLRIGAVHPLITQPPRPACPTILLDRHADHMGNAADFERETAFCGEPDGVAAALNSISAAGSEPLCHVLIIEDEPFIAMMLQDLLEEEGATSFAFATTEQGAVDAALAHPPAVITSDVKLVEGTGPHAVTRIHDTLGEVPVIFITGTPDDCRPCNPPGIILSKPMDHRAVASAFHELGPV